MSEQTICGQCGAAYDASIFLPGQSFRCIECDARIEASGSFDGLAAARAPGGDEPDTSIYQLPEALSRELPVAPIDEDVTHATSQNPMSSEALEALDLQEVQILDAAPVVLPERVRDVIVRGRDTIDPGMAADDELSTMQMPGLEGALARGSGRDAPTSVTHLEPGMLDTLTPPPAQVHEPEATDVASTPSIADFVGVPVREHSLELPAVPEDEDTDDSSAPDNLSNLGNLGNLGNPDDWHKTSESGAYHSAALSEELLLPQEPEEVDDEVSAASAAIHTLHSTVAARESSLDSMQSLGQMEEMLLPLEEDTGTEALVAAVSFSDIMDEEATISTPSSAAELAQAAEVPAIEIQAVDVPGDEFDTADEPSPEDGPSYEASEPLPSHLELAQVLEGAGPLVVAQPLDEDESEVEGEKATQMDFPVPVQADSALAASVASAEIAAPLAPLAPEPDASVLEAPVLASKANGSVALERQAYVPGAGRDEDRERIDFTPGGFWRRGLAWLIDVLLLYGLAGGGLYLWLRHWTPEAWIRGTFLRLPPPFVEFLTVLVIAFVCIFVVLLVNTLYYGISYKYKGASVGKGLLGLQVRHTHTDDFIGFKQAFLREVIGKFLSLFLLLGGFLMVGVRKDKQSLHDLVFTTQVVRRPEE